MLCLWVSRSQLEVRWGEVYPVRSIAENWGPGASRRCGHAFGDGGATITKSAVNADSVNIPHQSAWIAAKASVEHMAEN